MDDPVAVLDIEVELVQRFCSGGDKILLDVHHDVWALKLAPQHVTVAAKFLADSREEQLHLSHSTTRVLRTRRPHLSRYSVGRNSLAVARQKRRYLPGRSPGWIKVKNP